MKDYQWEILNLQNHTKKLERRLKLVVVLWVATFGLLFVSAWSWNATDEQKFDRIRVRQITVVDEKGMERIYIGSPVPDPMVSGKRIQRVEPSTGIILNNANGNEIGGWGVFDKNGNQNLCLDYPDGIGEALCLSQGGDRAGLMIKNERGIFLTLLGRIGFDEAEPKLFLNDSSGRTRIKIHAESENGSPKLEILDKNGKSVLLVTEPATEKRN